MSVAHCTEPGRKRWQRGAHPRDGYDRLQGHVKESREAQAKTELQLLKKEE